MSKNLSPYQWSPAFPLKRGHSREASALATANEIWQVGYSRHAQSYPKAWFGFWHSHLRVPWVQCSTPIILCKESRHSRVNNHIGERVEHKGGQTKTIDFKCMPVPHYSSTNTNTEITCICRYKTVQTPSLSNKHPGMESVSHASLMARFKFRMNNPP